MNIGVVTETKPDESRVALTPAGVQTLAESGHTVLVQTESGQGSYITDDEYAEAGATMIDAASRVWSESDMVVKVKEPQSHELPYLSDDQILCTFLHLAANPPIAEALCRAGTTSVAYETVRNPDGGLPLLAPMSEVAGRMSAQVGARFLEKSGGGRGILLGGVPGVEPARVVIIGGGMAGSNAVQMAVGLGADVTVFDLNPAALRYLDSIYRGAVTTLVSNRADVRRAVLEADLVIGAVLLPGAKAPRVLTAEDIKDMKPGSVVVDIAIDQGGCFETSRENPSLGAHLHPRRGSSLRCWQHTGGSAPHLHLCLGQCHTPLSAPHSRHGRRPSNGTPTRTGQRFEHPERGDNQRRSPICLGSLRSSMARPR